MEWTSNSFPSSSPRGSQPDDQTMFEPAPAYTSPVPTKTQDPDYMQPSFGLGLGISSCEMKAPLQTRLVPPPDPYTLSAPNWCEPVMPPELFYDTTPDIDHLSPVTCYGSLTGHTDVSASPLSYYSTQGLSASPTYSSVVDFGSNEALSDQLSSLWSTAPSSRPATPPLKAEELDGFWDQPLFNERQTTNVLTLTQVPRIAVERNDSPCQFSTVEGTGNSGLLEPETNVEQASLSQRSPAPEKQDVEISLKDISCANGLVCTVCGYRFTRRSNCREHMKRHDPSRKTHPCSECERTFGRRSDLQRHVDSIHRGLRKFGCESCQRRFTRQDTLSRHKADGCQRKPRKFRDQIKQYDPTQNSYPHLLPRRETADKPIKRLDPGYDT